MVRLPLDGLRIVDLSQIYAGPYASRLLADMGAEVIKIEAALRPGRGGQRAQNGAVYPDGEPGTRPYNRAAYYNELNRNKKAISLDLSKRGGRDVFRSLVRVSDVVVENFSTRVMANFGLGYPELRQVKPDIIMVSITAYGQTGSYRDYVGFGHAVEAMAGLTSMTGYPDSLPLGPGVAYADSTAGLHAAFAMLMALRHRSLTGEGQHIDLSLRESLGCLLGEEVLDYIMNQRVRQRSGNRARPPWLQGCYRCRDDSWIAIAIGSDEEWARLCAAIGGPPWAADRRFADGLSRWRCQAELDRLIEDWTLRYGHLEAVQILQRAGVMAGAVLDTRDLSRDPHLKARGFFLSVTHPDAGTHQHPGLPWIMSRTSKHVSLPAPCFAEYNHQVFGELLGLPDEEVAKMEEDGIAATVPSR